MKSEEIDALPTNVSTHIRHLEKRLRDMNHFQHLNVRLVEENVLLRVEVDTLKTAAADMEFTIKSQADTRGHAVYTATLNGLMANPSMINYGDLRRKKKLSPVMLEILADFASHLSDYKPVPVASYYTKSKSKSK